MSVKKNCASPTKSLTARHCNRPMRLQLIICHKKELLPSVSSIKLVLIRNKCYQCQLVCTIMINEWSKILAIETLKGQGTQL